jgi:hypothetical protein
LDKANNWSTRFFSNKILFASKIDQSNSEDNSFVYNEISKPNEIEFMASGSGKGQKTFFTSSEEDKKPRSAKQTWKSGSIKCSKPSGVADKVLLCFHVEVIIKRAGNTFPMAIMGEKSWCK